MEPAGVSGTVTISDQRLYIKIALYAAKIPQKSTLLRVKFVAISQWTAVRFLVGLILFSWWLCENRQRSTIRKAENINRLQKCKTGWQMLLKKIVVKHVKNFLELWEQKLRRKMHMNRSQLLVAGPLILHDNARPHISDVVTKEFRHYGWEVLSPCAL